MNENIKKFLKNVRAMFLANGIAFIISVLITFVIPKFLNIEEYAYVQLYIFYTSYISYLHYGWVDGIRLRYGGAYYEQLDRPLFSSQIWAYFILQILVSITVIITISLSGVNGDKKIALLAVGFCMFIRLPRLMPQYILELTNRIYECARITLIEKVIYLMMTTFVIFFKKTSIATLLLCDLCGQAFAAFYAFWCCRDIVWIKPIFWRIAIREAWSNIFSGIQLTIANVSSLLIIGIIRQTIENQWDVSTFGKVSLTISVSNLLMVFIRAVAMVMFPMLRRTSPDKLIPMYSNIRVCLMIPLLGMLIGYYPVKVIMSYWLPQYADSLKYMALLFPMCIFESKMSMLIETYLKTLRKEQWLLKINLITVVLSAGLAYISAVMLHNLTLTIVTIIITIAFRCVFAEQILSKLFNITVNREIGWELSLTLIFILSSWFIGGISGMIIYFVAYLIYLMHARSSIKNFLMALIKKKRNGGSKNEKGNVGLWDET